MSELIGFKSHCIIKAGGTSLASDSAGDEIFNFHFGYKKNANKLFEITVDERPDGPFSKSIHILKDRKQKDGLEIICAGENEKLCDTEEGAIKVAGWWAILLVRLMKFSKDFNEKWKSNEDNIKVIRHRRLFKNNDVVV